MSYLKRQEVIEALGAMKAQYETTLHAWGCKIPNTILNSISVGDKMVAIPVSEEDLKMIKEKSKFVTVKWDEMAEWHLEGSQVVSYSPLSFVETELCEAVSSALKNFKESDADVEAKLSHLCLYQNLDELSDDEHVDVDNEWEYNNANEMRGPGSFAKLVIQIPVEGGFSGGEFEVKNRNETKGIFTTSDDCHQSFYLTVFYDDCQLINEPLETGSRLELVFNLYHKDSSSGITQPLSSNAKSPIYRVWQTPPEPPVQISQIQLTAEQRRFQRVFNYWKDEARNSWVDMCAIPLDHSYCEDSLSFRSLKGVDRTTASMIISLLGDFVEVHLATVKKYIGYNEDDWAISGRKVLMKKNGGKMPKAIRERDWTEYWAGKWIDLQDRRPALPPLSIFIPDELLGCEETAFQLDTSKAQYCDINFEGLEFERAMIIIWPRNNTLEIALAFGLDQALDVAENFHDNCSPLQVMTSLLNYCEEHPTETWFPSTKDVCDDFRCFNARVCSFDVASKRALRLIKLCLGWKLKDCSLRLIKILFNTDYDSDLYCCYSCANIICFGKPPFVGGICSTDVAASLAELILMVGWSSIDLTNSISLFRTQKNFYVSQTHDLAHLAFCLANLKCRKGATAITDEGSADKYDDGFLGSCIDIIAAVDRLSSNKSKLGHLLANLKSFSTQDSFSVICWFSKIDLTLLKSLPSYFDFYMQLLDNLESQLAACNPPSSRYDKSFTKQEVATAQLMTSYLALGEPILQALIERITLTTPGAGELLSAALSSRTKWALPSSPSASATLTRLIAARIEQLACFKISVLKWKQPAAVFSDIPEVETFLRSTEQSMTLSTPFANEKEAEEFKRKYFYYRSLEKGYSATAETIRDGDGKVFVKISKTTEIYALSLEELEGLIAEVDKEPTSMKAEPSSLDDAEQRDQSSSSFKRQSKDGEGPKTEAKKSKTFPV